MYGDLGFRFPGLFFGGGADGGGWLIRAVGLFFMKYRIVMESQHFFAILCVHSLCMKHLLPSSVKLALAFLVFGSSWILFSDSLTLSVTNYDLSTYNKLQSYKGVLFMTLAALLIYFVSHRLYSNLERARKQQEELLERYELLGMATNDGIWDYNMHTKVCYTNRALQEMLGYTSDELQDNYQWWTDNLHPADKERVMNAIKAKLETGGTVWQDEYRFRCKNGEYKTVLDRGFILRDKAGKPSRLIGALQDVTEHRRLQQTLIDTQSRHKSEVAQSVLQAGEAERKKLGEELHDNINQLLGVVKLYIQHALVHASMREELLEKCSNYISEAIEEIRKLSRSLLAPALQEQGLLESLHQLIDDIRAVKQIDIQLEHDGFDELQVPEGKRLILYRIIQEQLNNALKHSNAQSVVIRLSNHGDCVHLMIRDNGVGFDPETVKPGVGLNNIRNRTEVFNGIMELRSKPGKGCELEVRV